MGGWAPHCDGRQFAALEKNVDALVICCYYSTSALPETVPTRKNRVAGIWWQNYSLVPLSCCTRASLDERLI